MKSWRCSDCNLNWPFYRQYAKCLQCEEGCTDTNIEPMSMKRAEDLSRQLHEDRSAAEVKRRLHAEFERWYADREVKKFREELDSQALLTLTALPTK